MAAKPTDHLAPQRRSPYYKPKRRPAEQVWPGKKVSERVVTIEPLLHRAIGEARGTVQQAFQMERKTTYAIALGYFCDMGMRAADGATIAFTAPPPNERTVNTRIQMPVDNWRRLDMMKLASQDEQVQLNILDLVAAYVRLGLQVSIGAAAAGHTAARIDINRTGGR